MKVRTFLNGEDVTGFVDGKDFPEYVEEGFKGVGYFEYQVKPLSFRFILVKNELTINRGDWIEVKDPGTGEVLFRGFVDGIEDEFTSVPRVNIYPSALMLKDVVVGEKVDTGDDEEVYEFDTGGFMGVRDIIGKVLEYVNQKKGTNFRVTPESCPDPEGNPGKRFFGNILREIGKGGFIWNVLSLLIPGVGDGGELRSKDGSFYWVEKDGGLHVKTWIKKGAWVNVSVAGVKIKVPPKDIKVITLGAYYRVFRCIGGGLSEYKTHEFFPLPPFLDRAPDLGGKYGGRIRTQGAGNVNSKKIKSFLNEMGVKDVNVVGSFDLDAGNSYVMVRGKRKKEWFEKTVLLSFETPFDFSYWATYRDATAMEVIRDLGVVTNRWFMVGRDGVIWFLPRGSNIEEVDIDRRVVLNWERKREKEIEEDVELQVYEEDRDGAVTSYGLRLRKNEVEAIRRFYREVFQGERMQSDLQVVYPPESLKNGLMKKVSIDGEDVGTVIETKRSILEPVMELGAERYV